MEQLFIQILKLGISAAWLILIIALLRIFLKKAPKGIICIMWFMVWLRLVFPFSIESRFSLVPDMSGIIEYVESQVDSESARLFENETEPSVLNKGDERFADSGVIEATGLLDGDAASELYSADGLSELYSTDASSEHYSADELPEFRSTDISSESKAGNKSDAQPENRAARWLRIAAVIWLAGMAFMIGYMIISYAVLRRKLSTAVLYKENIRQSEFIDSPFIFGIIKPIIYIPYGLESAALDNVLAHEKAHLARKDHLTKFFAFMILSAYWFHPLVWMAYMLFCKDIEAACDEKTIAGMGDEERMSYALTLLSVSGKRRVFDVCPIGFGELGVKERILRIKAYKKPALGLVFAALLACALAAVCFLTSPKQEIKEPPLPISYYYYANYWAIHDMSETIFPNKESLEEFTLNYLKEIEELLDCGGWWKEINPQAKELQITYYMQDANRCNTSIPTAFGQDSVAVSITLSRSILQNMGLFCEDAGLTHELGHVVLYNSFSISLEDGMCEYLNEQISPYSMLNKTGIPFQDLICLDIQYGIEQNQVELTELDKVRDTIGKAGRSYPYAGSAFNSELWYYMSLSFVDYLIDIYSLSDVVELVREGATETDYKKYLGHSLEELKEDWWNSVINYQSEYSLEDIKQKILSST